MEWLNIWGMIFIVVIMIPNIIFAHKYKDGFGNAHISRIIICTEQIGRYGCIGFMFLIFPVLGLAGGLMKHSQFISSSISC